MSHMLMIEIDAFPGYITFRRQWPVSSNQSHPSMKERIKGITVAICELSFFFMFLFESPRVKK